MSVESQQRHDLEKTSLTAGVQEKIDGEITFVRGDTVPSDASTGYAKGCMFIKTDGGAGSTLYINEGTSSSSDFNAK
jgi:hypothetical protein